MNVILVFGIFVQFCLLHIEIISTGKGFVIHHKKNHINFVKNVFLNTWAVVVHGDEKMAQRVATENGFVNKGRVRFFRFLLVHNTKKKSWERGGGFISPRYFRYTTLAFRKNVFKQKNVAKIYCKNLFLCFSIVFNKICMSESNLKLLFSPYIFLPSLLKITQIVLRIQLACFLSDRDFVFPSWRQFICVFNKWLILTRFWWPVEHAVL